MGYDKQKRPAYMRGEDRAFPINVSTAANTSQAPRGFLVLESTSTSGPVVYTLQAPKKGDIIEVGIGSIASSSVAPYHINAGTAVFGSTCDMATLSTAGAGFQAFARSSSQWIVTGNCGATFSTST